MINQNNKKHYIAVIGGSISGSEAANILANKGFGVIVFEMNDLPYGKIEDGLPKWHVGLRDKQEKNIDDKLNHENIHYVPHVKIGSDILFQDLVENWGFTAVILANGAWKDRELPIEDIDKYINNGLIYQNALLHWYNHRHEPNYTGIDFEIEDGTIVVGGGLASLDVMKLSMIDIVKKALLEKKGIDIDLFKIEKQGIPIILKENETNLVDLGIKGTTLIYRREAKDMPLKSPKNDTPEEVLKAQKVSEKLLNKYKEKYLFNFMPLSVPVDKVEYGNKLKSIIIQKVKLVNDSVVPIEGELIALECPLIISSIGSLPEQIDGLFYDRSWLKIKGNNNYVVYGFNNVFAIGNAVTGRGNIQESKSHGKQMTERIISEQLSNTDLFEEWLQNYNSNLTNEVKENITDIEAQINKQDVMPDEVIENILKRTKELQNKVGFKNYIDWVELKTPIRLENMSK